MHSTTLTRTIAALVSILAVTAAPGRSAADPSHERWYIVELEGERAGWMHARRHEVDGRITTESETLMALGRGAVSVRVRIATKFVESADGRPLEMESRQDLGTGAASVTRHVFEGDAVKVTREVPGLPPQTETVPAPGGAWLTPAAATRALAAGLEAGDKVIEIRTVDPMSGLEPVTVRRAIEGEAVLDALGRRVPGFRAVSSVSSFPGIESEEFLDPDGHLVRTASRAMGMRVVFTVADEALATSPLTPPEMLRASFIRPDRPIDDPRSTVEAAYIVRTSEGDLPALPSAGAQAAVALGPDAARVTVRRGHGTPPARGEDRAALLAATPTLQTGDDVIRTLAGRAVATDPTALAEELRRLVYGHVRAKGLSVGFATAAEVARSREGDCTEHAVLLAALLRAREIPSRVVSGVVYGESFAGETDIFAYHMWTQALLPGPGERERWFDLDATLSAGTAFDATHIALALSDLSADAEVSSLAELAPLVGRLTIEVEQLGR